MNLFYTNEYIILVKNNQYLTTILIFINTVIVFIKTIIHLKKIKILPKTHKYVIMTLNK